MRCALCILLLLAALAAPAAVVRLAPDFTVLGAGDKVRSLRSFRGQPVVLVMSDSPRNSAFRKQLKNLQEVYQKLASEQAVLVAAVSSGGDGRLPSNTPMAVAADGAATAAAYGMQKGFSIAIIGRDGNLDYQTGKVLPPERIRDVIQNSFEVQASARNGTQSH